MTSPRKPKRPVGARQPPSGRPRNEHASARVKRPRSKAEGPPAAPPGRWWPSFWSYPKHAALCFATEEDLDEAIELLWTDGELRGLPRVHVGAWTMIVPAEAVPVFEKKARNFTVERVVSAGDLPAEEVNRVRRGDGAGEPGPGGGRGERSGRTA